MITIENLRITLFNIIFYWREQSSTTKEINYHFWLSNANSSIDISKSFNKKYISGTRSHYQGSKKT